MFKNIIINKQKVKKEPTDNYIFHASTHCNWNKYVGNTFATKKTKYKKVKFNNEWKSMQTGISATNTFKLTRKDQKEFNI